MVIKENSSHKTITEHVYDYLTTHRMATALQLEQELGVDIKLIRDALNRLAKQGRITERYTTTPRPPRVVLIHPSPSPPRIIPARHVTFTSRMARKPSEQKSAQVQLAPLPPEIGMPPRVIRPRIPGDIMEEAKSRIQRARAEQFEARRKQKEIKKTSRVS